MLLRRWRASQLICLLLAVPGFGTTQNPPLPPGPPAAPPTQRPPAPDSAQDRARRRQQAAFDSLRRAAEARSESTLRARREEVQRHPAPTRGPAFGSPPFFGYTWVFYADLVLGSLTAYAALRLRHRRLSQETRATWAGLSFVLGSLGGAAVFFPFFMLNALLLFFNPMAPWLLFVMTAVVILASGLGLAVGGAAPRRPLW